MTTIYHASVKTFSRSNGQSAVAAAAYRAGVVLVDERTGRTADYTARRGVVSTFLTLPAAAPPWMADRSMLWNMAEWSEKRRNSTVARELEIALPAKLSTAMREQLVRQVCNFIAARYGVAVDAAIHLPSREGDERNHHAHIMFTTRVVTRDGFGAKTRILDDRKTGPEEVKAIRREWADLVNNALSGAGLKERVDHRSHKDRGIDVPPQIHVGVNATAAARQGHNLISFPALQRQGRVVDYPKIDHGGTRAQHNAEVIQLQNYRAKETLSERLARVTAQLADTQLSMQQLESQINSDLLPETARARIRLAIEALKLALFRKAEVAALVQQVKDARAKKKQLKELKAYMERLIIIQREAEQAYEAHQAEVARNIQMFTNIMRMATSLNGVPPWIIKMEVPLSARFDEATYQVSLKKQDNETLLKAVLGPSTKPAKPALAPVTLRQDVLQVKELLARIDNNKAVTTPPPTAVQARGLKTSFPNASTIKMK